MVFQQLTEELGWPDHSEIFDPAGGGAKVIVQLAQKKLGRAIARTVGHPDVRVGILAADPETSEAPLALVCRFATRVQPEVLFETQRLAWNFSRSLLLITIEPHTIRAWSCCEPPLDSTAAITTAALALDSANPDARGPQILPAIPLKPVAGHLLEHRAAASLAWVELVSGAFFQSHAERFPRDRRADHMLLSNLKEVRQVLRALELDDTYSHDLLARIIFVQFLFDRKDSHDHAALNAEKLRELHAQGILSNLYTDLAAILENYDDTYALFGWLNHHFNGDLFPGESGTPEQQQAAWEEERRFVQPVHLAKLADFVRGDMRMADGQRCLWRQYAFDVIPLDFISSIYEEFVGKDTGVGIHYTRGHLVDLMLDRVLPWDSIDWDLRLLDPACGSGIFLVKAYQRLIYRWELAHPGEEVRPEVLKQLLEHNLVGIDQDTHAVRVAAFSLYLAMCDEIDPRHYWSDPARVRFPPLRNRSILQSDFFAEEIPGVRTREDTASYDIVIGNPPWGGSTVTQTAMDWARAHNWQLANKDFGMLFVAKSAELTKPGGVVCLVQSANALLANQSPTAVKLRHKLFQDFKKIEGVINLAAFRLTEVQLFRNVKVPTCILILRNVAPDGEAFLYECPKPLHTGEDTTRILIEDQDAHFLYPEDVADEPAIWSILMWGGQRDRDIIRRLRRYPNLEQMKDQGKIQTRRGIDRGSREDRQKQQDDIVGRRFIELAEFSRSYDLQLDAERLEINSNPYIYSKGSTDLRAFALPQLIIRMSWVQATKRFQAKMVQSTTDIGGVIFERSLVSVHAPSDHTDLLETSCACYNSLVATYYLFLTSGRFAFDRSEPWVGQLRRLPIPPVAAHVLDGISTLEDLDTRVYNLFSLQEAETILIEDMVHYTLTDFKGAGDRPGYRPTQRGKPSNGQQQPEPDLQRYCEIMLRVLKAAYGQDKAIGAVIFSESAQSRLPVRLVAIYLNDPVINSVQIASLQSPDFQRHLLRVYNPAQDTQGEPVAYQRCVRTYDTARTEVSTSLIVHIVKPNQMRYWTRSMALRDADEIAADMALWATSASTGVPQ
jgi:hypothetical protein